MKLFYKFKFYFNARHSVVFNNTTSNIHPHTWEIVVLISAEENTTVNFTEFENQLEDCFSNYEGKYLNELEMFKDKNPTMENIAKVLYADIKKIVNTGELYFKRIEISENPTRTYIIEE